MKNICTFILLLILQHCCAQQAKYQWGIRTGNHFSFAEFDEFNDLKNSALLRYSAGTVLRIKLKDHYRGKPLPWVPMVRDGVFALDVGMNVVFKGYDYQIHSLKNYQDQLSIEMPILISFWDNKDRFISRKWRRNKMTIFSRMGLKPALLLQQEVTTTIENTTEKLIETANNGGFNLFSTVSIGIIKQRKNGGSMSIELSGNVGWFATTSGVIDYENFQTNANTQHYFSSHGHYASVNVLYFFGERRFGKEIEHPIIYSPRF